MISRRNQCVGKKVKQLELELCFKNGNELRVENLFWVKFLLLVIRN